LKKRGPTSGVFLRRGGVVEVDHIRVRVLADMATWLNAPTNRLSFSQVASIIGIQHAIELVRTGNRALSAGADTKPA
jgi:hypothetical protein